MRALDGPLDVAGGRGFGLGYFLLEVEQVLEDAAADWEAGCGSPRRSRYAPGADARRAVGAGDTGALRTPRARA